MRLLYTCFVERNVDPSTAAPGLIPNGLPMPYENHFVGTFVPVLLQNKEAFVGKLLESYRSPFINLVGTTDFVCGSLGFIFYFLF